jgi:ketosteroid isomerase-like protein
MKEFRAAVEAGDFAALGDLLADDVVFRSPVAFKPYEGRALVAAILRGVGRSSPTSGTSESSATLTDAARLWCSRPWSTA